MRQESLAQSVASNESFESVRAHRFIVVKHRAGDPLTHLANLAEEGIC